MTLALRTLHRSVFAPARAMAAILLLLAAITGGSQLATAQSKESDPKPAAKGATLRGIVIDSIRMRPLTDATVLIDGTVFSATTTLEGLFQIDSIPPGNYRIAVFHPLLDTLGIAIATNAIRLGQDSVHNIVLGTPSGAAIIKRACTPLQQRLGPHAIMGQITNPDTRAPMDSVRVTMVWRETEVGKDVGFRRIDKVRETFSRADGTYTLCGLPADAQGTIQAELGEAKTAEVPVVMQGTPLLFQSLQLSLQVATDSANLLVGEATMTGKVITPEGIPIPDARISVYGAKPIASTGADGEFRLAGLPSGTRTAHIRRVGYRPAEVAVNLGKDQEARMVVRLAKTTTSLDAVEIEGTYETELKKNGFTDRKRMGMGRYLTPDDIARRSPQTFSGLFATLPGFRVSADGTITSQRQLDGCVNIWIDGVMLRDLLPGELDNTLPPDQIMALETYSSAGVPSEYRAAGKSTCSTILVWTNRTVKRDPAPRKK